MDIHGNRKKDNAVIWTSLRLRSIVRMVMIRVFQVVPFKIA
jgi:hypothetical protein